MEIIFSGLHCTSKLFSCNLVISPSFGSEGVRSARDREQACRPRRGNIQLNTEIRARSRVNGGRCVQSRVAIVSAVEKLSKAGEKKPQTGKMSSPQRNKV